MAGAKVGNVEEIKLQVFSSTNELIEILNKKCNKATDQPYPAMYSSIFGGIVLDPIMMMIPIDDHMVHRGHGVFDTAIIFDGLVELAPKLIDKGHLKAVRTADTSIEEAKAAAEMMFVGSSLPIAPIIMWDGKPIGNGKVGELTLALSDLLWNDMGAGPETHRIRIIYE